MSMQELADAVGTLVEREPDEVASSIRDALRHEAQLTELIRKRNANMEVEAFLGLLADAVERDNPEGTVRAEPAESQLSERELAELRAAGVHVPVRAPHAGAVAETVAELATMVADSMSVQEAAVALGVDASRIRQRLIDRSLYGLKWGRNWRVLRFQFAEEAGAGLRQIRGLAQVLPALARSLHPVAVHRWLTTPLPDIELDGGALSPLEWLGAGGDVGPLVDIAQDL